MITFHSNLDTQLHFRLVMKTRNHDIACKYVKKSNDMYADKVLLNVDVSSNLGGLFNKSQTAD